MNTGGHRPRAAAALHHHGPASAELATRLRHQLIAWARGEGLPADTTYDIGLASYEAMANTVIHAYPHGTVGPLELFARMEGGSVVVTVRDHGRWPEDGAPGHGLALIRELPADSEVDRGRYGTTIRMSWPRQAG
jgi:anti-sigma regulatory factor (Ser/Thr protein kinase)